MIVPRNLLWIDGAAGASVGVAMLLLRDSLHVWYGLPQRVVDVVAVANVAYGIYALALAARRVRPEARIRLLVAANAVWAIVCVGLAATFASTASALGLAHLIAEAVVVGGLAGLEWRWRASLRSATARP